MNHTKESSGDSSRLERFCIAVLSAPAGKPQWFYTDNVLTLLFALAAIIALALSTNGIGAPGFWVAVAVAGSCLRLATRKRMLFAGALGLILLRMGFTYLVTLQPLALLISVASAVGLWLLFVTERPEG